jgi:hypothetical protein
LLGRGWDPIDLAREAHLSPATVSTALNGRPIAAKSLSLMVQVVLRNPPIGEIDDLILGGPERDAG